MSVNGREPRFPILAQSGLQKRRGILELTGFGLFWEFTLSANSGRSFDPDHSSRS